MTFHTMLRDIIAPGFSADALVLDAAAETHRICGAVREQISGLRRRVIVGFPGEIPADGGAVREPRARERGAVRRNAIPIRQLAVGRLVADTIGIARLWKTSMLAASGLRRRDVIKRLVHSAPAGLQGRHHERTEGRRLPDHAGGVRRQAERAAGPPRRHSASLPPPT